MKNRSLTIFSILFLIIAVYLSVSVFSHKKKDSKDQISKEVVFKETYVSKKSDASEKVTVKFSPKVKFD